MADADNHIVASTSPPPLDARRRQLAVIDDDEAILTLVARVLADYDVLTFDRPEVALRAFADGLRPHLVISDIQMPGLSGFALHEAVRRIASLRSVPFVYLTALADRESLRRGMVQGADDYVTKPFSPSELREAVAARFARHEALAEAGEPDEQALHVVTMGSLSLTLGEERRTWEARRVVELLAYLLDARAAVSVDRIRLDLFGGAPLGNHLHVLVSRLRKTLGPAGRIAVMDEHVAFEPVVPVLWDVAAFEAAAAIALATRRASDVESAIAAYGGEFLGEFDSPWADARRAHLEARFETLLEVAIEVAADGPDADRARSRLEAFFGLS
jgi:DNA-binding response OmpR family regulator